MKVAHCQLGGLVGDRPSLLGGRRGKGSLAGQRLSHRASVMRTSGIEHGSENSSSPLGEG